MFKVQNIINLPGLRTVVKGASEAYPPGCPCGEKDCSSDSNSSLLGYIHLCASTLEKHINPLRHAQTMG